MARQQHSQPEGKCLPGNTNTNSGPWKLLRGIHYITLKKCDPQTLQIKLISSTIKIFLGQTKNEKHPELDSGTKCLAAEAPAGEQR